MDNDNLKRKTVISALSLFFQSGYAAVLALVANVILTVILSPKIFGIYIATLSVISILSYFSDIGLAASLIQKKDVRRIEEKTAFTVQQTLVIFLIVIGILSTSAIQNFYKLPKAGSYLLWALFFEFFLSSFKTIPTVFLERKIRFEKIVLVQIVENTMFYLTVIIFSLLGFGLNSFTVAVILRSISGVITIYLIYPWLPGIGFDRESFRKLSSFGIPFQVSSLLALVKDDLFTLYLGKAIGFQALGYVGWAKNAAELPIRTIMDNISRIFFPLFARFQTEKERLSKLIDKIIHYQSLIVIPSIIGAVLVVQRIIAVIPKYSKWDPALPLFYLFCLSALLSSYSTPFINFLNGIGKVKVTFYFMVGWTLATWILAPVLIHFFGMIGFPITLVILSLSCFIVVAEAKKSVNFGVWKNIKPSLVASVVMSVFVLLPFGLPFGKIPVLLLSVCTGIISYLLTVRLVFSVDIIQEIRSLLKK